MNDPYWILWSEDGGKQGEEGADTHTHTEREREIVNHVHYAGEHEIEISTTPHVIRIKANLYCK
jgi:hypothetical protein